MKPILFILLLGLIPGACTRDGNPPVDAEEHHDHAVTITMWSEKLELFMEHPPMIANQSAEFIIHLTKLDDFKPVTHGRVELAFAPYDGETITVQSPAPAGDGIFMPTVTLAQAKEYDVLLSFYDDGFTETFDLGHMDVFADEAEAETNLHGHQSKPAHAHEGEASATLDHRDDLITFLKEQQWKTDFQTAFPQRMDVKSSVEAVAKVVPHQYGYADVVSPMEGYLKVGHNQNMALPGRVVKAGDILATVCPHASRSNTWTERQLSYQRAKKNFERAAELFEREAISEKEYEGIQQTFLIEKAAYEALKSYGAVSTDDQSGCSHFYLKSPIDGIVAGVYVLPGQAITTGEKIATIIDPSIVWLQANVFEKDYYKLGRSEGASLVVPGLESPVHLDRKDFLLLNKGDLVNVKSQTIPVLYEIPNRDRLLKIGQVVQAVIYTAEEKQALCIPESALLKEDGHASVFVQREGEAFERRDVTVGAHFNGWVAIESGLEEGERVVTQGAYQVKLASVTTGIGHAHVH